MATRNDTNEQNKAEQNKAADEAARTARTVADETARVGEHTARAGADMARRGTETARDTFQSGLNTATETFQRMTDQFTQVLGFNGPQSEELARRSSQNIQEAVFTTTVDCSVMERGLMRMPMSGLPDIGDSLGRPDLAPDCGRDRLLRTAA